MNTLIKHGKNTLNLAFCLLLTACATTEDIKRSSSLIRMDNQMNTILQDTSIRASDEGKAKLAVIASDAKEQAVKSTSKNDAIAFYRLAATAEWQQQDATSINDLATTVNSGLNVCESMKEDKPDRDCFLLKMVLPFHAFEINTYDFTNQLTRINFSDSVSSDTEVTTLNGAYSKTEQFYSILMRMYNIDSEDKAMLADHPSLKNYFCTESQKVFLFYSSQWGPVNAKTSEFESNSPAVSVKAEFSGEKMALLKPQTLKDKYPATFSLCNAG